MLSAGIPIIQNAKEAKPPERKFAVGVLIYGKAVVRGSDSVAGTYRKISVYEPRTLSLAVSRTPA